MSSDKNIDARREENRARAAAWRKANPDRSRASCAAYYKANREKILEQQREYNLASRERKKAYNAAYRSANKEKMAVYKAEYYKKNHQKIKARSAEYYAAQRERRKAYQRAYSRANREKRSAADKKYREANAEKVKMRHAAWMAAHRDHLNARRKARLGANVSLRLGLALRTRINDAIRNSKKVGSAVRDLGCTIDFLKKHLELHFQPGMTWDNWSPGGWHIDHVLPLAKFDLTNRNDFLVASNWTNLRPMWAIENIRKGAKIVKCA